MPEPLASDGGNIDSESNETNDVLTNISSTVENTINTLMKLEQDINDTEIPSEKIRDIISQLETYLKDINGEKEISQKSNKNK